MVVVVVVVVVVAVVAVVVVVVGVCRPSSLRAWRRTRRPHWHAAARRRAEHWARALEE